MKISKKGFSLIELVIVIAILAILAAVLAPSLIHYVEDSRASSDTHTMDEVVNAVHLGLAESDAYDEMVKASVDGNVSCYIDSASELGREKQITKLAQDGTAQYTFGDDERLLDEVPYTAAGNMRGVTITFVPDPTNNNLTYNLEDAIVNKHIGWTKKLSDYPTLYNKVRQTIGDTINLESATYGNSEYTVFVKMGTTGGNEAMAQDAIQVYGQYNGTNLPPQYTDGGTASDRDANYTPPSNNNPDQEDQDEPNNGTNPPTNTNTPNDPSNGGSGTVSGGTNTQNPSNNTNTTQTNMHNETIPDGGTYYIGLSIDDDDVGEYQNASQVLTAGQPFPTPKQGDAYVYGDYEYRYQCLYWTATGKTGTWIDASGGWGVRVRDYTKAQYENCLEKIAEKPITYMNSTYKGCEQIITLANTFKIPDTVKETRYMFGDCTNLVSLSSTFKLPSALYDMSSMFDGCEKLKSLPVSFVIPNTVTSMNGTFHDCYELSSLPNSFRLPTSLRDATSTFKNCRSLQSFPDGFTIPNSITTFVATFEGCTSLKGLQVSIPTSATSISYAFAGCNNLTFPSEIIIPQKVTSMRGVFQGCYLLEATITVNQSISYYDFCFEDTRKTIYLTGTSDSLFALADTNTHNNVFVIGDETQSVIYTFKLNGKQYQYEDGMTWERWVNSAYNTDNYVVDGNEIQNSSRNKKVSGITKNGKISSGASYSLTDVNTGVGGHSGGSND